MKTTRKLLQILSITLLCLAMTVGLLAFPVAAEATPVAQVAVDDGKILNEDYPFLVDTGAGYATAEDLSFYSTMVAQFEAATGTLILKDYDGGAISTSAAGDLTIQLSGTNTISHDETGINMHYGGNLTITALYAATLNITNNTDDNKNYAGIGHKFDGALSLDATPSGDMITVTGNATVVINTALTYDGSCRAIGIVGHSGIAVSENASLHITATNENNNLAGCLFALGGDIEIDTTGDVSLLAQGESGNQSGENLLKASGTATLGLVGKLTMNWTYAEFYEESALTLDEDGGFTSEDYVIGTLTEDDTSKTYAYLFPISVPDGVAKVGDDAVTTATKGTTVTVEANPPETGYAFSQWGDNIGNVTLADSSASTTTFVMPGGEVSLSAAYLPTHKINVTNGTASVSEAVRDTIVTVTADTAPANYEFSHWTVEAGGVTLSDTYSTTTTFTVGDEAVTVKAVYTPIKYGINVTKGTASVNDAPVTEVTVVDTVTLTADAPAAGYAFKEWVITPPSAGTLTDANSATTTLTGVSAAITLEATYELATYTVTTQHATATSGGNPVTTAKMGDSFTVTAEERPGMTFTGWTLQGGSVDAPTNATATFTANGTGNISIQPTYSYKDYTVSIKDGKGKVNDTPTEITNAHVGYEITIVANAPESNYAFIRWNVLSGAVTLADAKSSTTTFTMIAGNVELQAVYAEIELLDRLDFTMIAPTVGAHPSFDLTPSDESKYRVDTVHIYLYEAPYPDLTGEDVYLLGKSYELELRFALENGYALADNAKCYLNGEEMDSNGTYIKRYYFKFPASITVQGGTACDNYDNPITSGIDQWVYLSANEAPEGMTFKYWKVTPDDIDIYYPDDPDSAYFFLVGDQNVEITAVFATPLEEMNFTFTAPVRGQNVDLTVTSAEPTKYWAEDVVIKVYNTDVPLNPSDKYLPLTEYIITFNVVTADGSIIVGDVPVYLNGQKIYGSTEPYYYYETTGSITVTNGAVYSDYERTQEITEATYHQYVYLKVGDVPQGKAFIGWKINKGNVTFSLTDTMPGFSMGSEDVEIEAVFATVLTEATLTVEIPTPGEVAPTEITSASPALYTVVITEIYLDDYSQDYPELSPTDKLQYGKSYVIRFRIVPAEGYTVTSDTKTTVNGKEATHLGNSEYRWYFETPVSITVTNGKAYTDYTYEEELTGNLYTYEYVYIMADPDPEGKQFLMWKIIEDGETTYIHSGQTNYRVTGAVITFEAIYAIPIDKIEITMAPMTVGGTPISTATVNSELYTVEIIRWNRMEGSTRHEMSPSDVYAIDTIYECRYRIIPKEGYCLATDVTATVNGKHLNIGGYTQGTAEKEAYIQLYDMIRINITVTNGGTLYVDGVPTNETKFLPGTVLTLVADESQYPSNQTFRRWEIGNETFVRYEDRRTASMTFTVLSGYMNTTVTFTPYYASPSAVNYLYTYVPHPIIGGTPSYDAGLGYWDNYYAEVLGWYEGDTLLENDHVFEAGKTYTVRLRATPAASYYFSESLSTENNFDNAYGKGTILERGENNEYVVFEASIAAKNYLPTVSVTIDAPTAGMAPSTTVTPGNDTLCNASFKNWMVYVEETSHYRDMTEGELFEVGKKYRVIVEFRSNASYFISQETLAYINGIESSQYSSGTTDGGICIRGFYLDFTVEAGGEAYDVTIDGGTASIEESTVTQAGGGITVTVTANAPAQGKAFKCWEIVSGENVFLADVNADVTTFVMPAGDVSIKAVYRNTPHSITVEDGTADLTEAGSGETVTVKADEAPDGKYFLKWECANGEVTFADANAKETTFVMIDEEVTVTAVYADKTLLEKVYLTIPAPVGGQLPSFVITSTEPDKYTATIDGWYDNDQREDLTEEDPFAYGVKYGLRFYLEIDEKYYIDDDTLVYVNETSSGYYSSNPPYTYRYADLYAPVPITVQGGTATDSQGNTITAQIYGQSVYLELNQLPDDQCFVRWEVVSGGVAINNATNPDSAYFYTNSKEPIVIRAVCHTHVYDGYSYDVNGHWKECTDESCPDTESSQKDFGNHSGGTPTCAAKALCSACGQPHGALAAHTYGDKIDAVNAQHTETVLSPAVAAHYHCTVCDTYFDENKNATTLDALTGEAPTHTYGEWNKNSTNHWKLCSCGKKDQEGAHVFANGSMICSTCSYDKTAPHVHGSGQKVNGQAASCTTDGWKDYYRCECEKLYKEAACTNEITDLAAWKNGDGKIPAGHTYGDPIAKVDANCSETGMQAHYECSVCHTLFDEQKNIKTEAELTIATNNSHSFGAWSSNGNGTHTRTCSRNANHKETANCTGGTATCEAKAVCSTCNTAYGSLGAHDYGTKVNEVSATHTKDQLAAGKKAHYQCSVCDAFFNENKEPVEESTLIIPAPTHTYGGWIKDEQYHWKTCSCGKQDQKAEHTFNASNVCTACGYDQSTPHVHGNGQKVNGQAASCTTDGWKDYYTCECGRIYKESACTNEISSLDAWKTGEGKIPAAHTYGDLIAKEDANCTETGMQAHYECSVCHTLFDEQKNVKTAAELTIAVNNSHSFGAWTSNGDGTHTRACSHNANHKETENCTGGTATCQAKVVCSTCNAAYGDLGAHSHSTTWSKNDSKHWHECACGDKKDEGDHTFDNDCDAECNVCGQTRTVTHSYSTTWSKNDSKHWHECACGDKKDEGDHIFDNDCDADCNVCGHTVSERIPQTGENETTGNEDETTGNGNGATQPGGNGSADDPTKDESSGIPTGAVVAIVVGSAAVTGIGGFALWWFVISKRSLAQLGTACKGIASKIGGACKNSVQAIKQKFSKK